MVKILTGREEEIIRKKIEGRRLSQNESNILSKSIRPKLKAVGEIDSAEILRRLEYNQRGISIEEKIKKIVLEVLKEKVSSIVLCGSAIQSNYRDYNDIDVIVSLDREMEKGKKREAVEKIEEKGREEGMKLDVQIYSERAILFGMSRNPSLIYQLKDSKVIYGKIRKLKKIEISPLDLRMKLDWSYGVSVKSYGDDIYLALRNALLVSLLMNGKVDNYKLKETMKNVLGDEIIDKLRSDKADEDEKKLVLNYLELLLRNLENKLKSEKWGKIKIENL